MTLVHTSISIVIMSTRRVSTNLPEEPPNAAAEAKGRDIQESSADGLIQAKHRRAYERFMALRGKVKFDIDLDELRGRNRH